MAKPEIRANLTKLKKEIEATIAEIDTELSESRPSLKLLVPRDDISKRYTLMGNKDVLVFIQTLMEKIFYTKPEPDEDEANLVYFKEQLEKSITLIGDNVKNAKSLHPAIGIPDITNEQYTQMVGRQEMFSHFKDMLKDFGL
ncbi:MAG: hypothetical protein PHN69_03525 [Candidatus Pacebacteria bacterium]|nr:hypothetical protein [Fermentimonas sp.]MDD4804220.1 hypothetical protein [Candidatus Paceibacterota bacterium]